MRRNQAGFSLMELIVVMGIIAGTLAIGIPRFNRSTLNLSSAEQALIATLRTARANATGRGVHFRVTIASTSYTVQRLKLDVSGNWVADGMFPSQTFSAPPTISFSIVSGDGVVEFDSRGMVVPPPGLAVSEIETLRVRDTRTNTTKNISVWPSGQALEV